MSNYPSSLDTTTDLPNTITDSDFLNSPDHATITNTVNEATIALETKVGTGASTPVANTVLRGTATGTTAYEQVVLTSDVSGTLPIANGGTGNTTGQATVNANLTGPITSVGNATSVASQTGTGSTFVMNTSPTLITPNLGTPSAGVATNLTGLPLTTGVTGILPIANGGTDSSTLNWVQVFNVVSYGATGNGTTNDYTAINNAVSACGTAGGGIVYFPNGTYLIDTTLSLSSNGVVLVGQSMSGVTLEAGASMAQLVSITGTPVTGCGIKNMTLQSNGNITNATLALNGAQFGRFEKVHVYGDGGMYAILLQAGTSTNTMHNNWSDIIIQPGTANNSVGMLVSGNFANANANTCYEDFDNVTIAWSAAASGVTIKGIWFQATDNVRMRNLHFYGVGTPAGINNAVEYDYTGTSATWPADTFIETVDFGGTAVTITNTGTPSGATLNRIWAVSSTNGAPAQPNLPNLEYEISGMNTWNPTVTGFSTNPVGVYLYTQVGKMVTLYISTTTSGTSNSGAYTISLPIPAATIPNMQWTTAVFVEDNGTYQTTPGRFNIVSGGTTLGVYKDLTGALFTASGSKSASGEITYESI